MGTFIRRQVYERVGISLVEVCESVGKSVISVFKRTKKGYHLSIAGIRDKAAGARFSKVPIINGPGKLSPFTLKIEVSIVLHLA